MYIEYKMCSQTHQQIICFTKKEKKILQKIQPIIIMSLSLTKSHYWLKNMNLSLRNIIQKKKDIKSEIHLYIGPKQYNQSN